MAPNGLIWAFECKSALEYYNLSHLPRGQKVSRHYFLTRWHSTTQISPPIEQRTKNENKLNYVTISSKGKSS